MPNQMIHVDHPEDERYDSIDIHVVERWKESELSGDEWRFSYIANVKRKGEVIIEIASSKMEWLLDGLKWRIFTAGEEGTMDQDAWKRTQDLCDQPGCEEIPVVFYKRLKRYTNRGDELAPSEYYDGNEYRQFCNSHRRRGDCDLDDADHNYQEIPNPKIQSVQNNV